MVRFTTYTRDGCGFCVRAKSLLSQKGVDFVEHNASSTPAFRAEMIARRPWRLDVPADFHRRQACRRVR